MKLSRSLFLLICFSTKLLAGQCLGKGENCVSPYIEHTPCCEGLSCKALLKNKFKCYPKQCIEAFGSCDPKDSSNPCCEGSCKTDPDGQNVCG